MSDEETTTAFPDYRSVMLPLTKIAEDGKEHQTRETINQLADQFGLSEAERLAPGRQEIRDSKIDLVNWVFSSE